MDIKCRACLATTEAKMYHSLTTVFPEYMKTNLTVVDLLEVVTSTSINMSYDLPASICTACLKRLKDCYNFIEQFKDAQCWLEKNYSKVNSEKFILKVEVRDEEFSKPVIFDINSSSEDESNNIQTNFEGKIIQKHKDEKNLNQNKFGGKPREKGTLKARKKREPDKKINFSRARKEDNDGVIIMSIEDVLQEENEQAVHSENVLDSIAEENNDLEDNTNIFVHNDHNYQKSFETLNEPNCNLYVMSVKDVVNSTTRFKVKRLSGVRRKKKGIITQSIDLVKNLERKTVTRRARKQNNGDKILETPICDICLKVYDSQKHLLAHKAAVHVAEWQEKFKCTICGVHCRTRSAFAHHKLKHKGKRFNCDKCEKVYLTNTQLKEHKSRIHGNGVPEKYLCTECGRGFKYVTGLNYHVISVHNSNNKPYMCLYCGFKCAQKSYLKRHERCHTDERPYKCKFCDRTFRGTAELSCHQLSHEGKFKYMCQYCGKGFIQTWNMKVHWLQHGGDYDCEICNRNFINETVLKFHYFHHHKIRNNGQDVSEEYSNSNDDQDPLLFPTVVVDDSSSNDIF